MLLKYYEVRIKFYIIFCVLFFSLQQKKIKNIEFVFVSVSKFYIFYQLLKKIYKKFEVYAQ
jgi:hypothetical protein